MDERELRRVVEGFRTKYGSFPEYLSEIPDFPYPNFSFLRAAVKEGHVLLQRFSFEYGSAILDLFATPAERAYQRATTVVGIVAPIVSIVMAVTVRWWWLIPGVLSVWLVAREKKRAYNAVIYRGALESELGFCFLYRVKQICLTTRDYQHSMYWRD